MPEEFQDARSQAVASTPLLFGKPTFKFGARRMIAAQAMGLRFFKLTDQDRASLDMDNFLYDGIFWDGTIVAFLALSTDTDVARAVRKPDEYVNKALAWAEAENIVAGTQAFNDVQDFFNQVIMAIVASSAEPLDSKDKPQEGGADPKAPAGADALPGE